MRQDLSLRLEQFKKEYVADEAVRSRIDEPPVKFIGDEIMELAAAALLQGENVLLSGGKATGKNILADNLAWLFARPVYTVSFHVNTTAARSSAPTPSPAARCGCAAALSRSPRSTAASAS